MVIANRHARKHLSFMSTAENHRRELFNKVALSVISHIENFDEVLRPIDFKCGEGVLVHEVLMWEKKNAPVKLPDDLKGFYSTFNGFALLWKVEIRGKFIAIGDISVNKLDDLNRVPIEAKNLASEAMSANRSIDVKSSIAFCLTNSSEFGQVILVYKSTASKDGGITSASFDAPEVWFVDTSQKWHYMAANFTHFLRLAVVHLGIYGWQLAYTPEGLPASTRQWMGLFCRERLAVDST